MSNKYNDFEILFIKNNYQKLSAKQIADILDRPLSSIQDKISTLNLRKEASTTSSILELLRQMERKRDRVS